MKKQHHLPGIPKRPRKRRKEKNKYTVGACFGIFRDGEYTGVRSAHVTDGMGTTLKCADDFPEYCSPGQVIYERCGCRLEVCFLEEGSIPEGRVHWSGKILYAVAFEPHHICGKCRRKGKISYEEAVNAAFLSV